MHPIEILATDMDGTFIPLEGNDQNRRDLQTLRQELAEHQIELVYVTGRHHEIVLEAIQHEGLPRPDWIICDVGTSIYQRIESGKYQPVDAYAHHLQSRSGQLGDDFLEALLSLRHLQPQEPEKQGRFKRSYYCDARHLDSLAKTIQSRLDQSPALYHVIASVDPFTGSGLIDLLPDGVSKAYALNWWAAHSGRPTDSIIFAGDSGNDFAALTAGYLSILVGNADRQIADRLSRFHRSKGWPDRLLLATQPATSGVLEGVRYFLDRLKTSRGSD